MVGGLEPRDGRLMAELPTFLQHPFVGCRPRLVVKSLILLVMNYSITNYLITVVLWLKLDAEIWGLNCLSPCTTQSDSLPDLTTQQHEKLKLENRMKTMVKSTTHPMNQSIRYSVKLVSRLKVRIKLDINT